jgi:ERCC4-related helicase
LEEQKWSGKEIPKLIQRLFQSEHIVRLSDGDDINHFLKKQNIEVDEIEPHLLYERAITVDSIELLLKERVRMINDNMLDQPNADIKPSPVLQTMLIPTLTGEKSLGQAESICLTSNEDRCA